MKNEPIVLTLSGAPVPWTPSRVVRGKYAFSPRYREKQHHQWEVASQYRGEIIEVPLFIHMEFHMPIPASTSKKQRAKMLENSFPHTKKPDCTNLQKYSEDCLIGIVIKDDSQVVSIRSQKKYSENPRSIITILKWEGDLCH